MFKEIVSATVARYIVVHAGEDMCDDCLLSCEKTSLHFIDCMCVNCVNYVVLSVFLCILYCKP